MTHVLVLADDECFRFTCAEVLTRLGFRATVADARPRTAMGREAPDVILLWEGAAARIGELRELFRGVPVVLCTWQHRRAWPGADAVVKLPFNADRVATTILKAVRSVAARTVAA